MIHHTNIETNLFELLNLFWYNSYLIVSLLDYYYQW